jgi:queuine tRNA-ribosyltransferase
MPLRFEITARSTRTRARVGRVITPHGAFDTPAFMPVGTRGSVKGLLPGMVERTGAQIILGNTYHLLLRPGPELIHRLGGLQRFTGWAGPMLTDSGGYQAYSMAGINTVTDDGVTFRSIIDGSMITMTPESAVQTQTLLGADIIMAFDDCPPSVDPAAGPVNQTRLRMAAARDAVSSRTPGLKGRSSAYDHARRLSIANERTIRWLERCRDEHVRLGGHERQALFGIVQGGTDLDQRTWSATRVCAVDLPGYAIGGVAVGEQSADIARVVAHTAPLLPEHKPRYLMGVGYERDLYVAVRSGVDMFDCVLPTRNGRNANAFTPSGQIRLRNAKFADDPGPIDPTCDCPACAPGPGRGMPWASPGDHAFSRAYIRHLFLAEEMLGPILVSLHNLRHFQRFMADLRATIARDAGGSASADDPWAAFEARWPVARGPAVPTPED